MFNLNPQWIRVEIRDDNGRIVGEMFVEKYTRLRIRVVPRSAITGPACFGDWSVMGCYVLTSAIERRAWTGRPGSGDVNNRVYEHNRAIANNVWEPWFTHAALIDVSVVDVEGQPGHLPPHHAEYVEGRLIHAIRDSEFGILHNGQNAGQNVELTPDERAWLDMLVDFILRFLAGRGYDTAAPSTATGTTADVAAVAAQPQPTADNVVPLTGTADRTPAGNMAELIRNSVIRPGQKIVNQKGKTFTITPEATYICDCHRDELSSLNRVRKHGYPRAARDSAWRVVRLADNGPALTTVWKDFLAARGTANDAVEDAA